MARFLMVQGTASGVGKSILTTALCRILTQDGYRVLPFKAQNITSNCYTLPNGDIMATSQALAAYACGQRPSVRMNPVLLSMEEGKGKVFVCGKELGELGSGGISAGDLRAIAFPKVLECVSELAASSDVVLIEGAGSPVEMNLLESDIVNMRLAEALSSSVLLVSDMDRGGVFASLYGTIHLLPASQRQLVRGIVVNKYIGLPNGFAEGGALLAELCDKPLLGVIPYTEIALPEEDSLCASLTHQAPNVMPLSQEEGQEALEEELDRLATHFRGHLHMPEIYSILNEPSP